MKKSGKFAAIYLLASAALTLSAVPALAGGQPQVDWSVSIGAPGYLLSPPPEVYVQPQRVYVQPQPIYVERPAVIYYSAYGQPYYVQDNEYRRFRHHRHGWHYHDED